MKDLPDNNRPGLYILFGQDSATGERLAYVGESENFFNRVNSHDAEKDFWDTAIVFTGELNRAYVKYLEHRATLLASEAKRMVMQNKVQPSKNSLSDYDKVAVEHFFESVQFILSALNYEIFDKLEDSVIGGDAYYLKGKHVDAQAKVLDNGSMLVMAGSIARIQETNSIDGWAKEARKVYLQDGRLAPYDENTYKLTEDIIFKSPSAAAAAMAAISANGWTAWKDASGNTLDQNLRK